MFSTHGQKSNQNTTNQSRKDGRTTQRDTPTSSVNGTRLKKSTKLALYLYIQAHYKLDQRQLEFIAHFQAKLNLDEIQSALKFVHLLTTNARTRARMQVGEHLSQLHNVKFVPFSQPRPKSAQQRRIGVGYRDKGSLPKPSKIDWDKYNERTVALREENAAFSFEILSDLLKGPSEENQQRLLSKLCVNYPEAKVLLKVQTHRLEHTGNTWKITRIE